MSTTLPALKKHFIFQLLSLERDLAGRFWNRAGEGRPWNREHPKYLPMDEVCGMLKMPPTTCLSKVRVFLENTILDL